MRYHATGNVMKLGLCLLFLFAQSGCTMFDSLFDSKEVKLLKNSTYDGVALKDGYQHTSDPFGGPGTKAEFAWSVLGTDQDGKTPIAFVLVTFSQSSSGGEQKLFAMALDGEKYKQTSFLDRRGLGALEIKKCASAAGGKMICDVDSYRITPQGAQVVDKKKAEFTVSGGQLSGPRITE